VAGADWLIHEIAGVGAAPGVEKFALDRLIRLTPIWNWITRTSPQYRFSTLRLPRRTASGILGRTPSMPEGSPASRQPLPVWLSG
jgi:hypothetical protein